VAVFLAAPGAAPVFELEKFLGSFLDEGFDGVLIAEPVAAGDGVVGVFVERVVGFDDAGGAAFCGDGVAPHGIDLGDDGDFEVGIKFGYSYGGAEASTTTSDQENVVGRNVHKDKPRTLWAAGKREPAAAKQEAMYFLREEKSREVKGGARVSEWQAKYSLIRFAFTRT